MIVHNFDPVIFEYGFLQFRWYSFSYILGILLGWWNANLIIKNKISNNQDLEDNIKIFNDFVFYVILGMILGGRLGYILFYNLNYYLNNLTEIFMIWKGGMSFHGGLIGIIIVCLFFKKKTKKFFYFYDLISSVAPIGLFFGRIANFINGELYGKYSDLPWSVIFPGDTIGRHPSQIYEAILEGVILYFVLYYFGVKKNYILKPGFISGLFLIFYSLFRVFCEFFREPDPQIGYLMNYFSMGMILSGISFLVGVIIFIKSNERT